MISVHHLDSATLKSFIQSNDVIVLAVLVLPISERCREFVEQYRKIAENFQASGIQLAQINFLGNGEVLAPFRLNSFPRVLLFRGFDNYKIYRGALRESDIISYLDRFQKYPVLTRVSKISLDQFRKSSDIVVLGFISSEDQSSHQQFDSLASAEFPDLIFGIATDPAIAHSEGITMPGVAVYRTSDQEVERFSLADNLDESIARLRKSARPLLINFAPELHSESLDMGLLFGYVFTEASSSTAQLRSEIEVLARKFRQTLQFSIADTLECREIAQDLHLDFSRLPAFAIREPKRNLRYLMTRSSDCSFTKEVDEFVQDYLSGSLKPTIKSEPIPEKSDSALVKVVGLNFQEIVLNESKDVLLVYCIDPCGPCDAMTPTLIQLAELYATHAEYREKILVAKIMYDTNDVPERGIQAFPTIKLYPAAAKDTPVRFSGDRTLKALAEHVRVHGTCKADLRGLDQEQLTSSEERMEICEQETCGIDDRDCIRGSK